MSWNTDIYVPIDCGLHSEFELAIMRKNMMKASWPDEDGNLHSEAIRPIDLITKNKEEYLKFLASDHSTQEVRLDRVSLL